MKVSVIVPIYNADKYLKECIESLLNQTYTNLEIICLNDGSTDSSTKICKELSETDNRIILIEKENTGVSATRNLGLKIASGEYIMFLDADDFLEPNAIEIALNTGIEYGAEIVQFGFFRNNKENKIKSTGNILAEEMQISIINYQKYFLPEYLKIFATRCVWGKLYKSNIIKNVKFDIDTYFFEDGLFNLYVLENSPKIAYTTEQLYFYRYDANSANNRFKDDIIKVSKINIKHLKKIIDKKDCYKMKEGYRLYNFECLKIIMESYILHEQNDCTRKEKKKIFKKMLMDDLDFDALKKINHKDIKESLFDRIVILLLKINFYNVIYYLFEFRKFIKKGV